MKTAKNKKSVKENKQEKIRKCIFIGFTVLFLAGIAIPLVLLNRKAEFSALERRVLAESPQFIVEGRPDMRLLASLPRQIDAYITDRFAFRSHLISLTTRINFFVLHKSHDKKLLVGKDKWLFYIDKSLGDEFTNFKKENLFTNDLLDDFMARISLVNDVCEKNGVKFIFLIVPTTSSVYPEKYPFPRPEGPCLTEQVIAAMPKSLREKTIFPLDYFISKKGEHSQPLYYNNGLHWNKLGAYYAYELLYQKLKADFPSIPDIEFKFIPYKDPGEDNYTILWWGIKQFGDFLELLKVEPSDGWGNHYKYIVCRNTQENEFNSVVGYASKKGKYGIVTENRDPALPTALVMRDSYFVDLEPFTSSIFSKAEYVWTQPEKRWIQYLETMQEKPDVFIWEMAERALEIIPFVPAGLFPYD